MRAEEEGYFIKLIIKTYHHLVLPETVYFKLLLDFFGFQETLETVSQIHILHLHVCILEYVNKYVSSILVCLIASIVSEIFT